MLTVFRGVAECCSARHHPEPRRGACDPDFPVGTRRPCASRRTPGSATAPGPPHRGRRRRSCSSVTAPPASRSSCCAAWPAWRSPPRHDGLPRGRCRRARRRPAVCRGPGRRRASGPGASTPTRPTARELVAAAVREVVRGVRRAARRPVRRLGHRRRQRRRLATSSGSSARPASCRSPRSCTPTAWCCARTCSRYRAHWITPEFEPRRYDTRFFAAHVPAGQRADDVSDRGRRGRLDAARRDAAAGAASGARR